MLPVICKRNQATFPAQVLRPAFVRVENLLDKRPVYAWYIAAKNHFRVAQALDPRLEVVCELISGHSAVAAIQERQHGLYHEFAAINTLPSVGEFGIYLAAILGNASDTNQIGSSIEARKLSIEKNVHSLLLGGDALDYRVCVGVG